MTKLCLALCERRTPRLRRLVTLALFGFGGALAILFAPVSITNPASVAAVAAETRDIKIDNYSFLPGDLTVPIGTRVTWTNRDETPHTVVAQDAAHSFKSGGLDTDDTFSFTFDKAGTYTYICSVHPYMTGKIVVQ